MQAIQNITLDFAGVLISTTDVKRAGRLGRRYRLRNLIQGTRAHFETTTDGTILVYANNELYELKEAN